MSGGESGDRTERWRESYRQARKDPLTSSATTNRRRLSSVGATGLGSGGRWLDGGSGDGNLAPQLVEAGAGQVVSIDYQIELIRDAPRDASPVVGSAVELPLRSASIDVAVVMDVLHHLHREQLRPTLDEVRRVLRPRGHLLVFEPVDTVVRRALGTALMSPLSSVTEFSRAKRRMVEHEADTLLPWLHDERRFAELLRSEGYVVERQRRGMLHGAYRCRPA